MANGFKKGKNWLNNNGAKLLLTEGDTDCHVIVQVCEYYNLQGKLFGFNSCGGCDEVLKKAHALVSLDGTSRKDVIGIVLDADICIDSKWESVKAKLNSSGYDFPDKPSSGGTILEVKGLPKIGIWLMPDNIDVGMLEDFCISLIDPDKMLIVDDCLNLVEEKKIATFKKVHRPKARLHTYLACQDEPGKPLGQAMSAKILEPNSDIAIKFKDWLIKLFS